MMPGLGSLRLRLLAVIGVSTVLLTGAASLWMFCAVQAELTHTLDTRLAASARMVAGMLSRQAQTAKDGFGNGVDERSPFVASGGDSVACEVSLMYGGTVVRTIARTADAPRADDFLPGFATREFAGERWRTYSLTDGNLRITTADRMSMRSMLVRDLGFTALVPFAVAFAGILAMIWIGVSHGLAPLERVRRIVAARAPGDDHPILFPSAPSELRPLTDTIEQLVARMSTAVVRERQFTDAAAHELRTPLTGVKLHLQVLQMAIDRRASLTDVGASIEHAQADARRMQHVLDQLLRLARVETAPSPTETTEHCDAWTVAAGVLDEIRSARGELEQVTFRTGLSRPVEASIPETLLAMALRNLLDNALRYSPEGSPVLLSVSQEADDTIAFCVQDSGPGMTDAQIADAPRRFWRAQNDAQGSGLGLAIVAAIAQRVHGRLALANRADRAGLRATLHVPTTRPAVRE